MNKPLAFLVFVAALFTAACNSATQPATSQSADAVSPAATLDEAPAATSESAVLRALIIDGQNNHQNWPITTPMWKAYLEETGRFTVDIMTSQHETPQSTDPDFLPVFSDYDVVLSNFGFRAAPWPEETKVAFDEYLNAGGGFVVVHAANNCFPEWPEYNRAIGLGGWGGRNESDGPYVYYTHDHELVRDDTPGPGGAHGPQSPFLITLRDTKHPITAGLPTEWMHANDELYCKLRGPAEEFTILATADAEMTERHEPMLMVIQVGEGRVFHTTLGHGVDSQSCIGFISTLQRGTEWAATGEVTIPIPDDFPTADAIRAREVE